ncbi:ATP-binding protein [Neptunomonas antarctica]|uniref:histidine kinase n=1 Tax=Neptunomonas antarctica TaxID=619304 RepID=A0A1N7LJD2_9GAMM|nr:ATP-binding protein [Neptunomonas antarctica]SIS73917.1 two-component system, OmpR family, sensor kinase [Neptunomonas antarctica]
MKVNRSIQRELTRWVLLIASALMVIGGLVSSVIVFEAAKDVQDGLLHEISILVREGYVIDNINGLDNKKSKDVSILIQAVNSQAMNSRTMHSAPNRSRAAGSLSLPSQLEDGLQTLTLKDDSWRVNVVTQTASGKRYVIAQQTEIRNDLALASGLNVFIPLLVLMVIMLLLIKWQITHQFKPLNRLAKQLHQKNAQQPEPLSQKDLPSEIVPFVISINDLMDRIGKNLKKQQRFIADAAHELRTPVTALLLQAENVEKALNEDDRRERQGRLQKGLLRLRLLLNQLLDLARLQSDQQNPKSPVSVKEIILRVIADLHPLAEQAKVDLGVLKLEDVYVLDQDGRLAQLVRNAIDNAIRYTPADGQVDVSLSIMNNQAVLRVEDTGKGITNEDLTQVFQPFYRSQGNTQSGNGLGLAISQEIAQRLGGEIQLQNRPEGGLVFTYSQTQIERNE